MHPAWPHGEIILTIFGHLLLWNYAQWQQKNPKVSTKIGQIQNKASKNYQIFQEFGQSGEISPSLVTLNASQMFPFQMKQKMRRLISKIYLSSVIRQKSNEGLSR